METNDKKSGVGVVGVLAVGAIALYGVAATQGSPTQPDFSYLRNAAQSLPDTAKQNLDRLGIGPALATPETPATDAPALAPDAAPPAAPVTPAPDTVPTTGKARKNCKGRPAATVVPFTTLQYAELLAAIDAQSRLTVDEAVAILGPPVCTNKTVLTADDRPATAVTWQGVTDDLTPVIVRVSFIGGAAQWAVPAPAQ